MFSPRIMASLIAFIALAGCEVTQEGLVKQGKSIQEIYPVKPGKTVARMQREMLDCKIEAAQRVSQNISVRTTPTYTTPVQTYCNNVGGQVMCNSTGGQTYGGQTYSYDANARLRISAEAQCLVREGYTMATVPKCPEGAVVRPISEVLYPLSARTCYVANDEGKYAFTESVR